MISIADTFGKEWSVITSYVPVLQLKKAILEIRSYDPEIRLKYPHFFESFVFRTEETDYFSILYQGKNILRSMCDARCETLGVSHSMCDIRCAAFGVRSSDVRKASIQWVQSGYRNGQSGFSHRKWGPLSKESKVQ